MDQLPAASIDSTLFQHTYISFDGIGKGDSSFGIIMATARHSKHAIAWEQFPL